MSEKDMSSLLRAKLGHDVFKVAGDFHIHIKPGHEKDPLLDGAVRLCPAGLYSKDDEGEYHISEDGCLECGTCKILCGDDVLDWHYPDGTSGVQYRF